MKKLFTLIATATFVYNVNAQSLVPQGVITTIYGLPSAAMLSTGFDIYNSSNNTLDVKLQLDEVSMVPGAQSSFCWGALCYGVGTYLSPLPATIPGTSIESSFVSDYYPNNGVGISTLDYIFFDMNNVPDQVTVRIYYDTQNTGLQNPGADNNSLQVAYSTQGGILAINYNLKNQTSADIRIIDMLGNVVKKFPVNNKSGNLVISSSGFASGVYFVSLSNAGKSLVNKKIVVNNN